MAVKLDANQLAAKYGYAATFFNSVPELKRLLAQAVAAQWTAEEFGARFMNTAWYKWESAPFKEWKALVAKNPGEANRQVNARKVDIANRAKSLGISLDAKRIHDIAQTSLMLQWDDVLLKQALAAEMKYKPDGYGGEIGNNQSQIRALASQFGVDIIDQDVFSMSQKLVSGELTTEGITEQIRKQAKIKYKGLADDIDRGFSVAELASGYVQAQARLMEIDPSQIDIRRDTGIQKALQFQDPATKGPMALWQYEQSLRKDPRWMQTKNAQEELFKTGTRVLQDFGLLA